jgi:hypothetical protein
LKHSILASYIVDVLGGAYIDISRDDIKNSISIDAKKVIRETYT